VVATVTALPSFEAGHLRDADGAERPYVLIGSGTTPMVVVPGAADGLRTCAQVALYLAWFYRERAERCRILILSRRQPLAAGFGVARHAADMIRTIEELNFGPAIWECLSAAGPIGQVVAVERPDLVRGLILSSSYDHVSPKTHRTLNQWLNIARQAAGLEAFSSLIEHKYRPPPEVLAELDPSLLPKLSGPGDSQRLERVLEELFDLDQRALVSRIQCPTLVIGGEDDKAVPADVQREMAGRIPGAVLQLAPGFGHFNDMENPEYQQDVERFAHAAWAR
jgi:pimeloyl-ACP methyl ester carboxylesterase